MATFTGGDQAKVKFVSLIANFRRMSSSQYNQIAWGYMVK